MGTPKFCPLSKTDGASILANGNSVSSYNTTEKEKKNSKMAPSMKVGGYRESRRAWDA